MNIHEHQAKEIFRRYGIPVPAGSAALSVKEVEARAEEMGGHVVVKAQIHAGGRGKAGGVKIAKSPEEARAFAASIFGRPLVTHQTGPAGRVVKRLLVEEPCDIERELYLGMVIDRGAGMVSIIASAEGGVEIEEVAARAPEKICREVIDPAVGLVPFQARRLAFRLGLPKGLIGKAVSLVSGLYRAFTELDCSLIEVNPLVVTRAGDLIALDAKMSFDDNALYRHPEVRELRDENEEDPREREAAKHGLSYIALSGNIGCMVNGAGLAMATMDTIKAAGGEPANFLDVGGGADVAKVKAAFGILLADKAVKVILINIFGGILRCDVLAEGVVQAAREVSLSVPLVVRMEGTNVEKGKQILAGSGINVTTASDMAEAARLAVQSAARAG